MKFVSCAMTTAALLLAAAPARADLSSWLAIGGGYGVERNPVFSSSDPSGVFSASMGVGTSPRKAIVVGGVFRTVTYTALGTDLSLSTRFASGGFARGQWGGAFDLGVVARPWREGQYGRYPLQGIFTIGAPWGFELGLGVQALNLGGNPQTLGAFSVLEIDLLRLTVMRQGKTDLSWWNASPAGGHLDEPEK